IKHVTEKPRPPREINPSISEAIERVVLHALEKDPNARPQTALELAREFETSLANEQETSRFGRSAEQQRVDAPGPPPRSYETLATPTPATDPLKKSGQLGTELISPAKVTAEQLKSKADTARHGGPTSDFGDQAMEATELLPKSEAPPPTLPPPVEKEKYIPIGQPGRGMQPENKKNAAATKP